MAKWRYERDSLMNLLDKRNNSYNLPAGSVKVNWAENDEEEEEDNKEKDQLESEESLIKKLLLDLKDDTFVRWSSAKEIARIMSRDKNDFLASTPLLIIDVFTNEEDDSAWHGGCLAFAELARRRLISPKQLNQIVPLILKALVYDKKMENNSLGRNVRDTACYVCWTLTRGFVDVGFDEFLAPFVNEIAGRLLIVAIFDREITCRRSASAAFQGA